MTQAAPERGQSFTGYTEDSEIEQRNRVQDGSVRGSGKERMTTKVSTEDVERVAELAHLKLTPDETTGMQRDLNAILDYIAELNELDTKDVVPLAQPSELADAGPSEPRRDARVPSLPRDLVMAEAPETNGAFFKVPKVIER